MKYWIVVCRTGRGYTLEHAAAQRRQFLKHASAGIERGWEFVCLTDKPSEPWHIPLATALPGWWALLEMFRFAGPCVLTGLDTLLLDDLDPLLCFAEDADEEVLYGIRDFYHPDKWASGVTLWRGNWRPLLDMHVTSDRAAFRGDQDYIEAAVKSGRVKGQLGFLQDHLPKQIISFKADLRRYARAEPTPDARVCCFHGVPRPWDIADDYPWVKEALTL